MLGAISVGLFLGIVSCVILLVRNYAVYHFRLNIIEEIERAGLRDIDLGREWLWRYRELEKAPYSKMVLMFWKPLRSFYLRSPAREKE